MIKFLDMEQNCGMFSIQVENSRPSHFFMINEKSRDLFIFDVDMNSHNEEAEVFTFK